MGVVLEAIPTSTSKTKSKIKLGNNSPTSIPKSSGPVGISFLPSTFSSSPLHSETNLTIELKSNPDDYKGGEDWLVISSTPAHIQVSIDRIKRECAVGSNLVAVAALTHGLRHLRNHEDILDLLRLKHDTDLDEGLMQAQGEGVDLLYSWFRSFPTPQSNTGSGRRMSVRVSQGLKAEIGELAIDLGITQTALSVLCLGCALVDQQQVLPHHKQTMERDLSSLVRYAHVRVKVGRAMLNAVREAYQK